MRVAAFAPSAGLAGAGAHASAHASAHAGACAGAHAGGQAGAPPSDTYVRTAVFKVFRAPRARLFSVAEVRAQVRADAAPDALLAANALGVVEARGGQVRQRVASVRRTLAIPALSDGVTVSMAQSACQTIRARALRRTGASAADDLPIGAERPLVWPSRRQHCMDGRREGRVLKLNGDAANMRAATGVCRYSQSGDRLCVRSKGDAVAPVGSALSLSGKPLAGRARP